MSVRDYKARCTLTAAGHTLAGVARVVEVTHGDTGTVRHVSFCLQVTTADADAAGEMHVGDQAGVLTLEDGRTARVTVSGGIVREEFLALCGTGRVVR